MNQTVIQALRELVNNTSNPLCAYVYDLPALRDHARAMLSVMPSNTELFYAAKANPEEAILKALAPLVAGFEAASGGELDWLYQLHPTVPLIFGGPGKLESELAQALDKNIDSFHVESVVELQRLEALARATARRAPVMLRMNISLEGIAASKLAMGGKATPFGLDPEDLDEVMAFIHQSDNLVLKGFHFHLMSHQLCAKTHLQLMALYFRTYKSWCDKYAVTTPVLNVGGGMGVDYSEAASHFDWKRFCFDLDQLINAESMGKTTIRFECGRFLTAACGFYIMEVLDIKKNHGEYFAIGRGGTHHFRTPAAQGHNHPFFVLPGIQRCNEVNGEKFNIVGQLCTPKDILACQQPIDSLAIGDYLVFSLAGAYAWNISHQNFLMHENPQKYIFDH